MQQMSRTVIRLKLGDILRDGVLGPVIVQVKFHEGRGMKISAVEVQYPHI